MCPESLVHLAQGEPASLGDIVTIQRFKQGHHYFTMYARVSAPSCPICLPEGSTVSFTKLPAPVRERVGEGLQTAVLGDGMMYIESVFRFRNGVIVTLEQLLGAQFEVIPALDATDREGNEVINRVAESIGATNEVVVPQEVGALVVA